MTDSVQGIVAGKVVVPAAQMAHNEQTELVAQTAVEMALTVQHVPLRAVVKMQDLPEATVVAPWERKQLQMMLVIFSH